MKKRFVIASFLLILLTTINSQQNFFISKFNLEIIVVENNLLLKDKDIKNLLIPIYNKNLLFLDNIEVKKILMQNSFIDSFKIKKKYNEVLNIAKKTHKVLKCRGITRSDFKFFNNIFYLLEINTQPGMTSLSLVPEIAKFKGVTFENLVEKILLDASVNK